MSSSSDNNSDTRDPSGFLKLDSSGRPAHLNGNESPTVVKIIGTARDDLNGLLGFCTAYNRDRERYMVTMASVDVSTSPNATVMALKPDNLTKASTIETYKAQFQALRTDPRVRQRLTEYYNWAGKYCHPYKVEHAAAALAIFLVLLMYFFGFTKTVMLVSAVVMVFCILVEDVIRTRKPWREVVRNFPSRSKSVIERQFPFLRGKLSENVAAGLVGVLIAFTVQSVFFTPPTTTTTLIRELQQAIRNHHQHRGFRNDPWLPSRNSNTGSDWKKSITSAFRIPWMEWTVATRSPPNSTRYWLIHPSWKTWIRFPRFLTVQHR